MNQALSDSGEAALWGAHASRVWVPASRWHEIPDARGRVDAFNDAWTLPKVRRGGTPRPTRGTRVLPGIALALLATHAFAQLAPTEPLSNPPATSAPVTPKPEEDKRVTELLKLKFDHGPKSIVQTLATLAESTAPAANSVERFKLNINAGRWQDAGAFLKTLPKKDATQVYEYVLKELDKAPSEGSVPQSQAGPGATQPLLNEEIADLADLAPGDLTDTHVRLLAALLKRVASPDDSIHALIERLERGSERLGGSDPQKRLLAARILDEAGRELEAGKFLPPLEPGRETASFQLLDLHVRHASKQGRTDHDEAGEQRAWKWNLLMAEAKDCPKDLQQKAWRRTGELLRTLPVAQGDQWLKEVHLRQPQMLLLALSSLETIILNHRTIRDVGARKRLLDLQLRIVAALLPDTAHRAQWQQVLDLFAANWIAEADYSKRLHVPPRNQNAAQYDAFGNPIFMGNQSYQSTNPNQLPAIPVVEVLPRAPDDKWLRALDRSLFTDALKLIAELHLKAEDDAKALLCIEQLAPIQPKESLSLANELLRVWAATHDPQRGGPPRRSGPIYYSGGVMMGNQPQGIPLTRALQQRNLEELSTLLARLRKLPLPALDDGAIVHAFTTAHSPAEVFREDSIDLVLGKDVKPETLAELLQTMRKRLATQWRKPSVQQQAKTQRTDAQIDAEILRGYELLGSLLEKALARQPDDWRLNLAQAATWFDWAEFQYGKKVDLAIYVEKRERSFAAFQHSSDLYAVKLPALAEKDETPAIFQQWLNANLGASDLAMVTRQQESSAKSHQRIRDALLALPGAAAERHLAALARAVTSSADSLPAQLKPAYLRAALAIVGPRPESEQIEKLVRYHEGLLGEIETSVRIDGDATVGHTQPFGVFLTVRHTAELERENSGGFSKWLRNQSQNPYFYSPYGIAPVDHREELEKQIREKLGEGFEVLSIVFHDDKVQSRGYGRPGWRETPLVYLLLKAKDASVDHLPALRLDVDFIDAKGPVVLPVESAVQWVDARPDSAPARPVAELEVTQILDDRAWGEGRLVVEVKATAKGLVPKFAELFDFAPTGFAIDGMEDGGPAVQRLASDGDALAAASERNWQVKLHADPAAGRSIAFRFPKPKSADLKVTYKRYADADLVEATPDVALSGAGINSAAFWGWSCAALATIGISVWVVCRRPKTTPRSQASAYTLPETVTPFSVLQLLRRIHVDPHVALSDTSRTELGRDVATIEAYHFSPRRNGAEAPDLHLLGRSWLERLRATSR